MKTRMTIATLIAGLSLATAAAYAATDDTAAKPDRPRHEHMMRGHHASMERIAVGNVLSADLATRTGKSQAEVSAMLKDKGPRETAEALGLDRDTMHAAMKSAHQTVIDKAVAAQLITAEQATGLAEAKAERAAHRSKRGKDADKTEAGKL